jgi:tripartite-type tricarboxylate transporter receptor subunit TctC
MPDIVKRLAGLGFEPIAGTPDDCAAHIREALAKWARVVAQAKIRVE